MSDHSTTIPIMYHGGTYGTYLEWCLTSLCSTEPIQTPFTTKGNSHKFIGNPLKDGLSAWDEYYNGDSHFDFVRFHPKVNQTDQLSDILDRVIFQINRAIYIYPDPESVLLTVNNFYAKIWDNWWSHHLLNEIDKNKIIDNWPVPTNMPIDDIPTWVKREFLSLYLMPAWHDQVSWNHVNTWSNPKCHIVFVNDLLHNFEETISNIGRFCCIDFKQSIDMLIPYHQENLKLQKFIAQDKICRSIIKSVQSNVDYTWDELPLPSEAWIQWQLRNLGYEIRCNDLDTFPTNSVQLKELLYPV